MYYAPGEHNPPHFHVYYNEYKATVSIDSIEIMQGELPRRQLRLAQAWAELHLDEPRADWQLAANGEEHVVFRHFNKAGCPDLSRRGAGYHRKELPAYT